MLNSATLGINHASVQFLTPKQLVAASRVVTSAVPYGRASSARSLVVHGSDPHRVNAGGLGRGKRVPTHSTPSSRLSASRLNAPSSPPVAKMTVQADTEIVKSPMDKRLYRRLVLANGLSVLLISDPEMTDAAATEADEEEMEDEDGGEDEDDDEDDEDDEDGESRPGGEEAEGGTKKAAAAMAVGIGSFSDPMEAQGLSHFLEHMLFMGSEKFPSENEYDTFLTHHGGSCNAFTEAENTCYHFDVQPNHLHGALDRFAQFFISPLVLEGAMDREVNSVDSEFVQVLQNDSCRLMQVQCHTAREGHPWRIFSWGNRKSLVDMPKENNVETRPLLVDYYNAHYKAEQMALVVLGGEDLDTLQRWVGEIFSTVKSGKKERVNAKAAGAPFGDEGMLYRLPAVKEGHALHLTFPLPALFEHYTRKPDEYISHLIGHEGRGSLLSALKEKGWATKLSAGVSDSGHEKSSAGWLFEISIALTEAGLEKMYDVAGLLFQYVAMMKAAGPQEWVYDELVATKKMGFRFLEEEEADEYTVRLASVMHLLAPKDILVADYLLTEWDPALITQTLECLRPDNVRLDLVTSAFELSSEGKEVETEPWFQVPFTREKIPAELLASWRQLQDMEKCLALPPKNEYIPRDLSIRTDPNKAAEAGAAEGEGAAAPPPSTPPVIVVEEDGLRVWHKLDDKFGTPRATVNFMVTSDAVLDSARAAALTHLALKLLEDALNETSYLADVAGLHSYFFLEACKISIKVDGFNDKLPVLLERVLKAIATHKVDAERFGPIREEAVRAYKNRHMKPTRHATYLRQLALRDRIFRATEQLEVLEKCTPEDVTAFLPLMLAQLHVEVLVHGNMSAEEALKVAALARSTLLANASLLVAAADRPCVRTVQLAKCDDKPADMAVAAQVINPNEDNSAVELYLQVGPHSARSQALTDVLEQLMFEPVYDTLRTKEQLGYTVGAGARNTMGVLGFCVVVQSSLFGVVEVVERIEAFLTSFVSTIADMEREAYDKQLQSLVALKLQKDKSPGDESDRHWDQIWQEVYDFGAREKVVEEIKKVTKDELLEWYKARIAPEGASRRRMTIGIYGRQHELPSPSTAGDRTQVVGEEAILFWKQEQTFYPALVCKP